MNQATVDITVTNDDPIDLPIDDEAAAMVLVHVPTRSESYRHHQPSSQTYFQWVCEIIDEAERILEVGGRLVLIVKHLEQQGEWPLDMHPLLLSPLLDSGFLVGPVYTWATNVAAPADGSGPVDEFLPADGLLDQHASSWKVIVATKNQENREPSSFARAELGLPHQATITDETLRFAAHDVWVVGAEPTSQGDLPTVVVRTVVNMTTFVDDLVVFPLAGDAAAAIECLEVGRRVHINEPDPRCMEDIVTQIRGKGAFDDG